jgi:hypothetical protein
MRSSLGLQGSVLLLVVVGSAALTFVVSGRLLWASLLALVCGFCEGRLGHVWDATIEPGVFAWPLLLLLPVVLGAGFAWKSTGWGAMASGWLGILWGLGLTVGVYWGPCWSCGDSLYYATIWAVSSSVVGAVLAAVGAALTVALRVMIRRLRP